MAHQDRNNLAKLIYSMPYGELMSVADDLSKMKDAEMRPKIETQEEYASLLYDWAESVATDSQ